MVNLNNIKLFCIRNHIIIYIYIIPIVTPELMATSHFRNQLINLHKRNLLARLVVDEVRI